MSAGERSMKIATGWMGICLVECSHKSVTSASKKC